MQEASTDLPCREYRRSDRAPTVCRAVWNRVVVTLIFAICVLLETQIAAAAMPAGEVTALRGQSFTGSGGQRRLLTIGSAVNVGDIVQTLAGARLKLRMSDGSVISIASGSEVLIRDYAVDASGQHRNAILWLARLWSPREFAARIAGTRVNQYRFII
jgi:hypothetical protein